MRNIVFVLCVMTSILTVFCAAPFAAADTVAYTYDDAGRLIKADYGEGKSIEYTYDNAGNLLQRTVTAQQPPDQFTLTAQKDGTGTGTVTSNPAGIDCGADCTQEYDAGTEVTLTAVAGDGSTFTGWTGGGCAGTGNCIVIMNAAHTVTAIFTAQQPPDQFTLTAQKDGTGTGTVTSNPAGIDCGADCTQEYDAGTQVTLTAVAGDGSTFTGWTGGGCAGAGNCIVIMNAAHTVTATFTAQQPLDQFTLTAQKDGTGTGTVTSNPAGIDCGADCTQDYDAGTEVTLTAVAGDGSTFTGWTGGGCAGTGNCIVTMDAAHTVTATFNAAKGGGGSSSGGLCFISTAMD